MATPSTSSKARKRDRLDPRKVRIKGQLLWQVELGSELRNGKRIRLRRTFSDRQEAETFSRLKRVERTNRGTEGVLMPELVCAEALESIRLLEPYGIGILAVTREYVSRREQSVKSETVGNVFSSFLAVKADDGMRARYLEDLRYRLGRFSESFGERKVADITASEIDRWLRELHQSPLSRNAFRLRLHTFFEFGRQRGWIQANPMTDVPKAKVSGKPPGILSPEQTARLLEAASFETLPVFALGLFAGLRSAEIERLGWCHLKWDEGLIEVPALSSKTASRRLVKIQPNLAEWLKPYRGHHGPIFRSSHSRQMIVDRRAAGITQWPNNAMRHSFASYHLAAFRDAPALSLELGHITPAIVFGHYREVVTPAQAERFWKIAPAVDAESKLAAVA